MPETIKIDHESQVPVYKQIVGQVEALVRSGEYAEGCLLPSMNELSAMLDISKETVKKAYSILRNKGFIDARQGKGFYVSAAEVSAKMSVLVLFDKLSNYKQVLFNSFAGEIGDAAEITIRLHNQNVELLEYYIEENLDLFDYYVIGYAVGHLYRLCRLRLRPCVLRRQHLHGALRRHPAPVPLLGFGRDDYDRIRHRRAGSAGAGYGEAGRGAIVRHLDAGRRVARVRRGDASRSQIFLYEGL